MPGYRPRERPRTSTTLPVRSVAFSHEVVDEDDAAWARGQYGRDLHGVDVQSATLDVRRVPRTPPWEIVQITARRHGEIDALKPAAMTSLDRSSRTQRTFHWRQRCIPGKRDKHRLW
jgi:hypothetical protein